MEGASEPGTSPALHLQGDLQREKPRMRRVNGILDNLGEEVTGVMAPVTICIATIVFLVRSLNPDGADRSSGTAATLAYRENSGDTSATKAGGALLNALIFVGIVTGFTCEPNLMPYSSSTHRTDAARARKHFRSS